MNFNA